MKNPTIDIRETPYFKRQVAVMSGFRARFPRTSGEELLEKSNGSTLCTEDWRKVLVDAGYDELATMEDLLA